MTISMRKLMMGVAATLALLERELPRLSAEGVELVTLTTLLHANMEQ